MKNAHTLITIEIIENPVKNATLLSIYIDKSQIFSVGQLKLKEMLLKLHVGKCMGDYEAAKDFLRSLSEMTNFWLDVRKIVIDNALPKSFILQGNLTEIENNIEEKLYDETMEGIVESYVDRFPLFVNNMLQFWESQEKFFKNKV